MSKTLYNGSSDEKKTVVGTKTNMRKSLKMSISFCLVFFVVNIVLLCLSLYILNKDSFSRRQGYDVIREMEEKNGVRVELESDMHIYTNDDVSIEEMDDAKLLVDGKEITESLDNDECNIYIDKHADDSSDSYSMSLSVNDGSILNFSYGNIQSSDSVSDVISKLGKPSFVRVVSDKEKISSILLEYEGTGVNKSFSLNITFDNIDGIMRMKIINYYSNQLFVEDVPVVETPQSDDGVESTESGQIEEVPKK